MVYIQIMTIMDNIILILFIINVLLKIQIYGNMGDNKNEDIKVMMNDVID